MPSGKPAFSSRIKSSNNGRSCTFTAKSSNLSAPDSEYGHPSFSITRWQGAFRLVLRAPRPVHSGSAHETSRSAHSCSLSCRPLLYLPPFSYAIPESDRLPSPPDPLMHHGSEASRCEPNARVWEIRYSEIGIDVRKHLADLFHRYS